MLNYFKALIDLHFAKSERGASAVEYGLLIAGIAAVIVAVVFLLGNNILDAFNQTNNCVDTNGANCAP